MNKTDFEVYGTPGASTVFLLTPKTDAARAWVAEHIPGDALTLGRGIAVEHRYIANIVNGIMRDGLTVTGEA